VLRGSDQEVSARVAANLLGAMPPPPVPRPAPRAPDRRPPAARRSRRAAAGLAAALAASVLGVAGSARAQEAPAPTGPEVAQAPPTTQNLIEQILQGLRAAPPPTTAPPAPAPPPAAPATSPATPSPPPPAKPQAATARTIPPEAQRQINSVRRTGSNNTTQLLGQLSPLLGLGLTTEEVALVGFGQFPVAGEAYYSDDWYQARFTPVFHLHKGTDVFAARGTPLRSPVDGVVRFTNEGAGGKSAYVTGADGTYYYFAHMEGFPSGVRSGQAVERGEVVGFVGSSGNAAGGAPHLHLQVHPGGGAPVNPKPYLDRWLAEASASVPAVLAGYEVGLPRAITSAGLLRRLEAGALAGPDGAREGPELWAQTLLRSGDARSVAELLARPSAGPDLVARGTEREAQAWQRAEELSRAVLEPLTPPVLLRALSPSG